MTDTDDSTPAGVHFEDEAAGELATRKADSAEPKKKSSKGSRSRSPSGKDKYATTIGVAPKPRQGPLAASQEPPAPYRCKDS